MSLNKKHLASDARAQKAYAAAKPINATPSRTLTNASSTGPLIVCKAELARPEGNDAANIQSRGYV